MSLISPIKVKVQTGSDAATILLKKIRFGIAVSTLADLIRRRSFGCRHISDVYTWFRDSLKIFYWSAGGLNHQTVISFIHFKVSCNLSKDRAVTENIKEVKYSIDSRVS